MMTQAEPAKAENPSSDDRIVSVETLPEIQEAPGKGSMISRLILAGGLLFYLLLQGILTIWPLQGWSLLPEADDTLTYVLKTRQMQECFFRDCPALADLRGQLYTPSSNAEAAHQRYLAGSRIFPVYHPLFSLILLALGRLGPDLMEAYRIIWHLGPLIFGVSFACLLSVLFGKTVAGLTLALLAFKVFPDTGLHNVVPSNLTMALAVLLLARIIARRGDAPYSLMLGCPLLIGMHIIGVIYSALALALACTLTGFKVRSKMLPAAAITVTIILLPFVATSFFGSIPLTVPSLLPSGDGRFLKILTGAGQTLMQMGCNGLTLSDGLFGSLPFFFGAATLGLLTLGRERRLLVLKFAAVYGFFLFALLFYVSNHPADVILRMWIPLVVVVCGCVGQALSFAFDRSIAFYRSRSTALAAGRCAEPAAFWPPVLLAVLLGYVLLTAASGTEQLIATAMHQRQREPLDFSPAQPQLLMTLCKPGDRVLYTSFIIMPYYLSHGALQLGAVYTHPALRGDDTAVKWLSRADLRFAAVYNPLVYNPAFDGVDESNWWPSSPEYRHSPLNNRRESRPLASEGKLAAVDFRWIELEARDAELPGTMSILVHNPGKRSEFSVSDGAREENTGNGRPLRVSVPAGHTGWIEVDTEALGHSMRRRLIFQGGSPGYFIGGLVFGRDSLLWPWKQKADMRCMPRKNYDGPITVSFDPAKLLPAPLNTKKISILDDKGSSVLMRIDPE